MERASRDNTFHFAVLHHNGKGRGKQRQPTRGNRVPLQLHTQPHASCNRQPITLTISYDVPLKDRG